MQAFSRFYAWRESVFELVLKVALETGALVFHVEKPPRDFCSKWNFSSLNLLLEQASFELCFSKFRFLRWLVTSKVRTKTLFSRASFHRILKENVSKNCSKFLRRSPRDHSKLSSAHIAGFCANSNHCQTVTLYK